MKHSAKVLIVLLAFSLVLFGCGSNRSSSPASPSQSQGGQSSAPSASASSEAQEEEIVFPEPGKPFYLTTNYGPGGTLQRSQQDFQPFFEKELGTQVIIEYIEGAGGLIGYNTVFARPADGYSILPNSATFGPYTYPHLSEEKPPWKYEDWLPLGIYSDIPNSGIVVKKDSPFKNFADLVRYARENPNKLKLGTIGPGRIEDIQIIELQHVMGIRVRQIYYEDGGSLFTDLLTGDLDAIVTAALQYVDSPDARILVMLAPEFPPEFPYPELDNLSKFPEELGFSMDQIKTLAATHFNGFVVKAGTPEPIYRKLVQTLENIVKNPEWQQKVKDYRYPKWIPPEEAKKLYDRYYEGIGEMVKLRDQYLQQQ
ncbi:MAG: hypothetical protein BAA02_10715 [Paenibacillaceae bacterium ZCTH02-B3]|mgnify:CR=1 FL=1|nr:MAG: hypothetical protein BAA02_10715 [Paenibacillaceae bacterium ZCTH02-B3]